jgi:hypothetical protein
VSKSEHDNHTSNSQIHVDPIIVSGGSVNVKVPDAFQAEPPIPNYKHFKKDMADVLCIQVFADDGTNVLTYNLPKNYKGEIQIWYSE